jgi:hypothetical protein
VLISEDLAPIIKSLPILLSPITEEFENRIVFSEKAG